MILRAVLTASFLLCYVSVAFYGHHMHQLNGYKAGVHLTWLRRRFWDYLLRHGAGLVVLVISLSSLRGWAGVIPVSLLFLLQAWVGRPRKAKKPLVFTPRLKRMVLTHGFLIGGAVGLSFLSAPERQCLFLGLLLLASPFVLLLSNLLNTPLERAINFWYVNDAKRILRESPRLAVIGVTGSYGKTSTKYFLQKLLSGRYNVLMTPESYNTTLGVVKTIRMQLRPTHELFVCEMGARNRGDIREICELVNPHYGVITSIGPQHLESFRTLENVLATKFELADSLPADGVAFLNWDDPNIRQRPCSRRVVSYGIIQEKADYRACNIQVSASGSSFTVRLKDGEERRFETRLIGRHNVQNLVGAIAVADFLDVPADDLVIGLRRLEPVPHRLQLRRQGGITIIDDTYNSNESGAKAALDALAMFEGFRILATPGMVELGEKEHELNRRFGLQAAEVCDLVIPVGEGQTASFVVGLREGGCPEDRIRPVRDIEQAFELIQSLPSQGRPKIVLLENDLPDNY
ncbi:MAG: UDP-N-acetylmuramoyl-tripeptide--D-alanyl-D-alanine ligase [Fretibacterium sp.]|nr:UDP-N-acetylmuramoyl-tripeptide--D-alanyl-D-alanine ligase [Fretibacterium sp.]